MEKEKRKIRSRRGVLSTILFLVYKLVLKSLKERKKEKKEFSKSLLVQESVLIWIVTLAFIILAFICIANEYTGELPWLAVLCSCAWAAYGVSQACYYNKSKSENTEGGIKYEAVMARLKTEAEEVTEDFEVPEEKFAPSDEKFE